MRLLLDTHIAIWGVTDDPRLSATARDLIRQGQNEAFVSIASIWEIAIKHSLTLQGRGNMALSGQDAIRAFDRAGFQLLAISADHAASAGDMMLPQADPFDRLLVAQALHEAMRLMTADRKFPADDPSIILV